MIDTEGHVDHEKRCQIDLYSLLQSFHSKPINKRNQRGIKFYTGGFDYSLSTSTFPFSYSALNFHTAALYISPIVAILYIKVSYILFHIQPVSRAVIIFVMHLEPSVVRETFYLFLMQT